jgi:hypothetical protein
LLSKSAAKCLDNAEMQFHLGMAHYMMGHEEAALTALRQASNAQVNFPGKEMIALRLALLGDGSGKLTQVSIDELQKILQQQPDDIVARIRVGECYENQGVKRQSGSGLRAGAQSEPEASLRYSKAGPTECRTIGEHRESHGVCYGG